MTTRLLHNILIGKLIESNYLFALYRLPATEEPCLAISHDKKPKVLDSCMDLNNAEGFVFAPFHISEKHPLLLIKPDVVKNGWDSIMEYLADKEFGDKDLDIEKEPNSFSSIKKSEYNAVFSRFITALQAKQFEKLVLSRCTGEMPKPDFSPANAFLKACDKYQNAFVYLCYTPISGLWLGCSPEILLKGENGDYQTVALAGTRKAKPEQPGATRWNVKNKNEQSLVADYLRDILNRNTEKWTAEKTETVTAGNVVHLKTGFSFSFPHTNRLGSLLQQLHPTPAVCGLPKEDAFRFILEEEGYDREYYSGFLGNISAAGQTDLYVNLRCMKIESRQLKLFAGGGLLASSTLETEWKETEEKLKTMRGIL